MFTDFDAGFDAGFFSAGVDQMAIDPDVQVKIDVLKERVEALEQNLTQLPSQITLHLSDGTTVSYVPQMA